ncbi:MAG: 4Fe-4S dicluster domain-containing protein [Rhodocyclaceae bacterium]|nr:4Fe-4S dicluster domain-containing protein [Rhodocyclaceae bacterium]
MSHARTDLPSSHLDWSAYAPSAFGGLFGDPFGTPDPTPVDGFRAAAGACNGRQACLSKDPGTVMCPSFRATGDPTHATEHRARTVQAALAGQYGDQPFASEAVIHALSWCLGCKACKRECPQAVDLAALAVEARARRWQARGGAPLAVRLLADAPRLVGRLGPLARLREMLPGGRWLVQRLFGIDARRALPRAARRPFFQDLPAVLGPESGHDVVLLVDDHTALFEPAVARAALDVLLAAGCRVFLPRSADGRHGLASGKPALSAGLVIQARREAAVLLETLAPHLDAGRPIIGLEPSFHLMLRDDLQMLGLGEGAPRLARHALLLEEYLARESAAGRLHLPLRRGPWRQVVVHGHCHQKAFGLMPALQATLGLIPGLTVEVIDAGCCGMAGAFGLQADNYAVSMAIAEEALLPAVRAADPATGVVANGMSCRQQIRHGSTRLGLHVAQVLQAALDPGETA